MSQPVKILQTIRQGKVGGGETHMYSLVTRLDRHKWHPIVLSFTGGPMVDMLKEAGIETHVIETTRPFDPWVVGAVQDLIEKEGIQLIHAHGTRAASNSFRAAGKFGIPMIYTVHGWSFHHDQNPITFELRKQSENLLTSRAKLNICVSHTNEREGQELFDMPRSTVIENGVDFEKFNKDLKLTTNPLEELGVPKDKVVIGYIVRMTKQKDPITLLHAIADVIRFSPKMHFLMVGEGDMKDEVVQVAKNMKIDHAITFSGFRSDIPQLLKAIDVYVLPSLWEGLPIGIIEAMAMQKPIVCSDIEANQELIKDGVNGLVVPTRHPKKLAEALFKVAHDKVLADQLAAQALEDAVEKFQLDQMVEAIQEKYIEVLK